MTLQSHIAVSSPWCVAAHCTAWTTIVCSQGIRLIFLGAYSCVRVRLEKWAAGAASCNQQTESSLRCPQMSCYAECHQLQFCIARNTSNESAVHNMFAEHVLLGKPAAYTRSRSELIEGLWSVVRSMALPRRQSTARLSPTWAIASWRPHTRAVTAVHPDACLMSYSCSSASR